MANSTFRRRRWLSIINKHTPTPQIATDELMVRPIVISTDENGEKELDVGRDSKRREREKLALALR